MARVITYDGDHPYGQVREHPYPDDGHGEREREVPLPAAFAAVGDRDVEEQTGGQHQRPPHRPPPTAGRGGAEGGGGGHFAGRQDFGCGEEKGHLNGYTFE